MPSRVACIVTGAMLFWVIIASCDEFLAAEDAAELDSATLREDVLRLREERLRKEAELEALQFEGELLKEAVLTGSDGTAPRVKLNLELVTPVIRDLLRVSGSAELDQLRTVATTVARDRDALAEKWRSAGRHELSREDRWREAEELVGLPRDAQPTWRNAAVSALQLWPWVALLGAISTLFLVHEWRRGIRASLRSLHFARQLPPALWWIAGLILFASGCSPRLPSVMPRPAWEAARCQQLATERQQLTTAIAELDDQLSEARKAADEIRDAAASWNDVMSLLASDGGSAARVEILRQEEEAQSLIRRALTDAFEADRLQQVLANLPKQDEASTDAAIAAHIGTHRDTALAMFGLKVGLSSATGLLVLSPLLKRLARRARQRRRWKCTCPRCLSVNTLESVAGSAKKTKGKRQQRLQCTAILPTPLKPKCAFSFPEEIRHLPPLCFPTVGVVSSGKTEFIDVFEELLFRDAIKHPGVKLRWTLPPGGITRYANRYKAEQGATAKGASHTDQDGIRPASGGATTYELPIPLISHVTDADAIPPRGDAALFLFDYAGEMGGGDADDMKKRRALLMDGFLLFLDPTRVFPDRVDPKRATLSQQIGSVKRYKSDLLGTTDAAKDHVVQMPVAVCISKIDLLPTRTPLGNRAHDFLNELRRTEEQPLTLSLIQERSNLSLQYFGQMFDNWNAEGFLRDNFGERFMFFPVTPLNINENELATAKEGDLSGRSFQPYGITAPILWLLHMYGYKVF